MPIVPCRVLDGISGIGDGWCADSAVELHYIVRAAAGVSSKWCKTCCPRHAEFSRQIDTRYGLITMYQKLVQPIVGSEESLAVEVMCHAFRTLAS